MKHFLHSRIYMWCLEDAGYGHQYQNFYFLTMYPFTFITLLYQDCVYQVCSYYQRNHCICSRCSLIHKKMCNNYVNGGELKQRLWILLSLQKLNRQCYMLYLEWHTVSRMRNITMLANAAKPAKFFGQIQLY